MADTIDFQEETQPQIDFLSDEDALAEPQRVLNQTLRTMELGALAAPEPAAPGPTPPRRVVGKFGYEPAPGTQTLIGPELGKLAERIPPGQNFATRPLFSMARTGLRFGQAALEPENLAIASAAISPPGALAAGAYYGYQAGKGALESVRNIIKLMQAPGPVDEAFKNRLSDELVNALSMAVAAGEIGVGEARGIQRMYVGPQVQGPLATGAILQPRPGAVPMAGPEVLGPPMKPARVRSIEDVQANLPGGAEPIVTAPEQGIEENQLQTIRRLGLKTKEEVLDQFPVLRTLPDPRERAARLLKEAQGPIGPPLPPGGIPAPGRRVGVNVRTGPLQGPDQVVAGTRPVVQPMRVENVPVFQGPEIPPEVQTQQEREANMQRELEARRSALQQNIIFWERELEMARNRGDRRGQDNAGKQLLLFRGELEGIPPVKTIQPKPPIARAPGSAFRPEVPGTPAEPRETVLAEIRRRGLKTKEEVLDAFPGMRDQPQAREKAAELLRQARPLQGPPLPPTEEPPATPPAEPVPKPPGAPPGGVAPEDLRPAVQTEETGPPAVGQPGETHAEVIEDEGKEPESIPHEDERRGFVDVNEPDKLLSRTEAENKSGLLGTAAAGGLDSQDLPAAQPTRIEDTVIAGKTLGEWEQAKTAAQLPKGAERAELARWLAVPNQPGRILQALGNKKRTREIHAPPVAEIPQPISAPPAEPQSQAPPATVEPTAAKAPAMMTEDEYEKYLESKGYHAGAFVPASEPGTGGGALTGLAAEAYRAKQKGEPLGSEAEQVLQREIESNEEHQKSQIEFERETDKRSKIDQIAVDVSADKFEEIKSTYFADKSPKVPRVFTHEGKRRAMVGISYGYERDLARSWELVPAEEYKGKTYTQQQLYDQWNRKESKRGDETGLRVTHRGKPFVLANPLTFRLKKGGEEAPGAGPPIEVKATVEAPPAPVAKAQAEVTKVAKTEGQAPAKQVKSQLLSELEQAIADAPSEEELIRKTGAKVALNKEKFEAQKRDIRRGKQVGTVTIDIPGDGVFKVINTKEALTEVLERAKAISTASGGPVRVTRRSVTKEQGAEFAKEAEQLAKGKLSKGPGAAAVAEFEEGPMPPPTPAVYGLSAGNPWWNTRVREFQNMVEGFRQLGGGRGEQKQRIAQALNAAKTLPHTLGQQAGNSFRLKLRNVLEQRAVTALMQAFKMSGEGVEGEDLARLAKDPRYKEHIGDPMGYLKANQADLETYAQEQLNKGMRLEAQAAIDLAQAMQYARDNFARLKPIAFEARRRLDEQILSEEARGVDTEYERWHVPQRHDLDLLPSANRPIVLAQGRGVGPSRQFQKPKFHEDYSSAIQSGLIPRSLSIADLIEHRVRTGEELASTKAVFEGLKRAKDPRDGKPIVKNIPKRTIKRPDGSVKVSEFVPLDYEPFDVIPGVRLAVHKNYARMMRALTGAGNPASESAAIAAAENIAGFNKHVGLAFDTFHLVRTLVTELATTGRISLGSRLQRGTSLLEYDIADLNRAVQAGEITQATADWNVKPQQWEIHGRTVQASPRAIIKVGMRNGLNVGRIADVIYKQWIRQIPVIGEINKLVFDKITRSAMSHGFLSEFGRMAKQHPDWTADKVASKVASDINVLFGNLQKESWIRSPSLNAIAQILFLAPNWVQSRITGEFRGVKQLAQAAGRLARGKPAQLETAGKVVGTGLAGSFILAQLVNAITRGHLTFQNEEDEHKLDAYLFDPYGKGFFFSPLAMFGEIMHDLQRYHYTKPDAISEASQIIKNKLGTLGRALWVLGTGRDVFTDQKIIGTPERLAKAAIQAFPVPIVGSTPLRALGSKVAPGLIGDTTPTDIERQAFSSLGVKIEPASSAQNQIHRLVDKWKLTQEPKLQADVQRRQYEDFRGPYSDLRQALGRGDMGQAQRAYTALRQQGSTPRQIQQVINHPHPFAGSKKLERRFYDSLTPEQQKIYEEAKREREQISEDFEQLLTTRPQITE